MTSMPITVYYVHYLLSTLVVVEITTVYLVQAGRFLATIGYVVPSPNHTREYLFQGPIMFE